MRTLPRSGVRTFRCVIEVDVFKKAFIVRRIFFLLLLPFLSTSVCRALLSVPGIFVQRATAISDDGA